MREQSSRKPESYVVTPAPPGKESFGARLMRLLAIAVWGMAVLMALLPGGSMLSLRGGGLFLPGILLTLLAGGVSGGILWAAGELLENVHRIAQSLQRLQVTPVTEKQETETVQPAGAHDAAPQKPFAEPEVTVTHVPCEDAHEIICPACGKRQQKGRTFCAFCSTSFTMPHEDIV